MKPTVMDSTSRFRFAPSPTGALHVGGARTALFNWLLARRFGGKFILRIEDTDQERSTEEALRAILDGLAWLGLDWDEGPYFQSRRRELYDAAVDRLIESGKAYPCFCTKERIDEAREKSKAAGDDFFSYDGRCRDLSAEEVARRTAAGEPRAIRFRTEPGSVTVFEDLIGGERRFENDRIGDFVIRRSDGWPIYHLTVVVDDHDMGITHVIRGDDHLANTPRQILLFEGLGWKPPVYGHVPLIQGPDRSRLSKRHGATSVMQFRDQGILPAAMFNFLALLGWSLDDKTEIMSRDELVANFSPDRFSRSSAIFDAAKQLWMNSVYMRAMPTAELARVAREHFERAGVKAEFLDESRLSTLLPMVTERAKTLEELREQLDFVFADRISEYEAKGAKKLFTGAETTDLLTRVAATLAATEPFDSETLDRELRALGESLGLGFGKIAQPLRLALTGSTASPGIFDVLLALGRERSVRRVEEAVRWISSRAPDTAGAQG